MTQTIEPIIVGAGSVGLERLAIDASARHTGRTDTLVLQRPRRIDPGAGCLGVIDRQCQMSRDRRAIGSASYAGLLDGRPPHELRK